MFRSPLGDGLVVLVILILFFGPKRLPMLSRSIGESIKEFKGGIGGGQASEEEPTKLPAAEGTTPPAVAPREPADTGSEPSS